MHRRRLQSKLATLIVLILLTACHGTDPHQTQDKTGNILYVDAANNAANPDGLSWATAFPDLQSAVDVARTTGGGEVWIAAGTYTGSTDPVLTMKESVNLYGGFAGTETDRNQRDWSVNVTVIDGEDKRRCVIGANNVVLDGFAITRGYACGLGGGMYNNEASPTVTNCIFAGNKAGVLGGGMYNYWNSSPTVTNCTFTENKAYVGGGMSNSFDASPTVTNCTFAGNKAEHRGGGMSNSYDASPKIINCILWGNTPEENQIYNEEDSDSNPTVTYSCVQGDYAGTGNINADPLFLNAPYSLQLKKGSPCIDAGIAEGAPVTDLFRRLRPQGDGIDMGAYEGAVTPEDEVTLAIDAVGAETMTPPSGRYLFCKGNIVLLHAYNLGALFSHWSGDFSGNKRFNYLLMDSDKTVTAHFQENIYFVDAVCTVGTPDGRSWQTAFSDLQSAVNAASAEGGGEIRVAAGTYTGTTDNPVLTMKESVNLYGGFAGTETDRNQRDWRIHTTIIDGEDKRRCVIGADNAVLDGFTITRGYSYDVDFGGAGMYNYKASPTVTNCIFASNTAAWHGGGMYNKDSSPTVTKCTFERNTTKFNGGGMYNFSCSPTVANCIFSGNTAGFGGGMANFYASPKATNCSFAGNTADSGGGMDNSKNSLPTVTNCILWGNAPIESQIHNYDSTPIVTYSCVQGGYTGTDTIDADPKFVAAPDSLELSATSPCIDKGTSKDAPESDILGRSRPKGAGIDMGAYEYYDGDK